MKTWALVSSIEAIYCGGKVFFLVLLRQTSLIISINCASRNDAVCVCVIAPAYFLFIIFFKPQEKLCLECSSTRTMGSDLICHTLREVRLGRKSSGRHITSERSFAPVARKHSFNRTQNLIAKCTLSGEKRTTFLYTSFQKKNPPSSAFLNPRYSLGTMINDNH